MAHFKIGLLDIQSPQEIISVISYQVTRMFSRTNPKSAAAHYGECSVVPSFISWKFRIHLAPSNACCRARRTNTHSNKTNTVRAVHDNSSSDEDNHSTEAPVIDEEDKKIMMDVSPSVFRRLQGQMGGDEPLEGVSLIDRNQRKRAALMAEKRQPDSPFSPIMANEDEEFHVIYRAFQEDLPMLQKPGSLDIDMLLRFLMQFVDLSFVMPSRILLGKPGGKPLDEDLLKESVPSIFLAASFRRMGGLQFDRDKEWYSERLVLLLVYNQLVKELAESENNNSKAEKLLSAIAKLEPMVMTVVAPRLLLSYAFENSGFVPDGRIVRYEDGLIFPGKLSGKAGEASDKIQQYMDFTGQDNGVIVLKDRRNPGEVWCLIAPWSWFMATILPDKLYNWVAGFLIVGALIGALQFKHADPGLEPIVWEAMVIPSVFWGIVGAGSLARRFAASKYEAAHLLRWPIVFPFPGQGAVGAVTGYRGCLPNRSCLLNLSLASVCTSLALSSVAVFLGHSIGSADAFSDISVDFHGYFLVPVDMFSYSNAFTVLLRELSAATFREEIGNVELAMNPLALAGLLGLKFCSFQLLPVSRFDGARILAAILGRNVQRKISVAVQVLLTACLIFKSPLLGLVWLAYLSVADRYDDLFQREEITEPSIYAKLLGMGLVSAGLISFIPAP